MNITKLHRRFSLLLTALLALVASAQAQSFPTDGLVAYYPFSGNALDATGNGHDGLVMGATLTTNRFGQADSAYAFDGLSSLIVVSNSYELQPLGDFTVSLWAVVPAFPSDTFSVLMCKHLDGANGSGWGLDVAPPLRPAAIYVSGGPIVQRQFASS